MRNRKANNSLDEIMAYCTLNLVDCSENDFDTIKDESGYVSYRFKSYKSYTAGMQYGLQILINLEDIKCDLCYLDGLRVIVHNHSVDPGYYSGGTKAGFTLSPGFSHEIIIKRTFSSKLGWPYNDCIKNVTDLESFDSDLYRFMLTSTNHSYRQVDCFDYCMGRELNNNFNISNKIDHWLKLYKKYSFDKFWLFYSQFIRGDINDVCRPLCPLECDSIKYEVFNSFTKISDNEFKNLFEINASMNNVIWANIYYDNLEYTSISQLPHMDILDLISSIGSNLSLFIGISFISLAEIFELFVEILLIFFESKKIKTQATSLLVPLSSPSKLSNENDSAYKQKKKRTYSV